MYMYLYYEDWRSIKDLDIIVAMVCHSLYTVLFTELHTAKQCSAEYPCPIRSGRYRVIGGSSSE